MLNVWQRKMNVGWFEAMVTPMSVVLRDLDIISLESDMNERKQNASNAGKMKKK